MRKARRERLSQAKTWFASQKFNEDSHIVKAYRKHFKVDKTCAMRELCMLKVLSPQKQSAYEAQLKGKDNKKAAIKRQDFIDTYQYDRFFFIAAYTSGGAPYGTTCDEELEFAHSI